LGFSIAPEKAAIIAEADAPAVFYPEYIMLRGEVSPNYREEIFSHTKLIFLCKELKVKNFSTI
jgi:hypothetical protein